MLVQYKEKTKTRRFSSRMKSPKNTLDKDTKSLKGLLAKHSGRSKGRVTVRHQGGRHKRFYRMVEFKRNKFNIGGEIVRFEYDPNRNVNLAVVKYDDGQYTYILAGKELKVGDMVMSGDSAEVKAGNCLKLRNIPVGTMVHNVELIPGAGGKMGRSAGTSLIIQAKEGNSAHLKLPSGEVRMVSLDCSATVGVLGNEDWKNMVIGKAGRARHMGRRPGVRGTAMDPNSHPHGGGEGRSGVGRKKPMTVYGKPAVGKTRKKGKWTSKYILKRRKGN